LSAKESLAKLQLLIRRSPENLNGKVFMVEAELKALDGNIDQAVVLFQKAMDHPEENDLISDRALICEQAGLTLRFCGKEDQALDYLEDCCAFYRQWGALIKVNHVKEFVIPQAIYAREEEYQEVWRCEKGVRRRRKGGFRQGGGPALVRVGGNWPGAECMYRMYDRVYRETVPHRTTSKGGDRRSD
jgi:hypothetical protein